MCCITEVWNQMPKTCRCLQDAFTHLEMETSVRGSEEVAETFSPNPKV
jgi:hypothetical protein